jgi:hypothetical protein
MKFVENGPDVPDRLIEAHEDGRVVFFCGAGISYPANLPTFKGLVQKIYASLGEMKNGVEQAAFEHDLFDTTLGLLESRIVGGRTVLRQKLAEALQPDHSRPRATDTHQALLTLSKSRNSSENATAKYRLITTNFDRIFETLRKSSFQDCPAFAAPLLPVPKQRWDGLVYLHGLLPETPTESELDRLVVTSGDFGLAYLSERWAARFVSELFRNFTVCFVGYSLNDPILRYMRDALAADAQLGESAIEAFAFGGAQQGQETNDEREWSAKNVTPILYSSIDSHALLHRTLKEWAGVYRDGISGKERIVVELAQFVPTRSTVQDDPIGRLLWAIADKSGLPAKRFAELDPVPPIEWLGPLTERRFAHSDLGRFGVTPNRSVDKELRFSVAARPAPYGLGAPMRLVRHHHETGNWDEVMNQLGRWLARHLDKVELILWVAKEGGRPHDFLRVHIEAELQKGLLTPPYQTLWSLISAGCVTGGHRGMRLFDWVRRWKKENFSPALRFALRVSLRPMVELDERWSDGGLFDDVSRTRISDLVNTELVLATQHGRSLLEDLRSNELWSSNLFECFDDFSLLLTEALELKRVLDDGEYDRRSYLYVHSIKEHTQNSYHREWTLLVDLCRDSWLSLLHKDAVRARDEARKWERSPHSLFNRLALFAASQGNLIDLREALDWLLVNNRLWTIETQREALRLIVAITPRLDPKTQALLEKAIVRGPRPALYSHKRFTRRTTRIRDHEVWLRLSKLANAGANLTDRGAARLESLTSKYPNWRLAPDDRDEFPSWIGEDTEPRLRVSPNRTRELAEWLRQFPSQLTLEERDDWAERCRSDFPRSACALMRLSREGHWIADRWQQALQIWSEERLARRSWRWLSRVLEKASNPFLRQVGYALSSWVQAAGKFAQGRDDILFGLVARVLTVYRNEIRASERKDFVSQAINHPVGHVVEGALLRWYQHGPKDSELLPSALAQILTVVCDMRFAAYRNGRVLLGAHVIALFRVDVKWTTDRKRCSQATALSLGVAG